MSKALVEDLFNEPEWAEETAVPATDRELLLLTERISSFEIPMQVFLQAVAIAAYDCASAFRYADNYLTTHHKNKRKNLRFFKPLRNFENN
ncbi:hypothetical protein H6G74_06000 [Nostoc spongiaeforme FACHB-130]|uniref:Uncharacterized protein n=1 Tax=Nostoc spongiaeforme FACHB-130 TaxID=1357510 RepID=A0ABR8FRK1_9NOSO|nr:hypothetical protein [Nostoc spongiaeforme]MBD2593882.1 hypothetical protein [Nostoc spongiaeforme FACHB-130]